MIIMKRANIIIYSKISLVVLTLENFITKLFLNREQFFFFKYCDLTLEKWNVENCMENSTSQLLSYLVESR